jgi:iron complex transport system ATP-binding protein
VVSGVSLEVAGGEFVGLIGPNGAGKSTLIKAVTGSATVVGGSIEVCGTSWTSLDARSRARHVAVVPQALPEPFSFSGREYVEMGRYPYLGRFDRLGSTDFDAIERAMELTDTSDASGKPVNTLSGGDLQRLTLAQALAQEPDVLLLDEPTSHLDLNHQLQVLDVVRSRLSDGLSVLGVFHDIGLAARYADRIAILSHGRLRATGPPAEVITADVVREVFGVRAVVGSDAVTGTITVTPILRDEGAAAPTGLSVLVVGGSGASASIMRELVQAGYEVASAALNEGDVDEAVADALGIDHVKLPPFGEMDADAERAVLRLARTASIAVVGAVPFGRANVGNLRAVVGAGKPTVLVGAWDESGDFTGGEASRLVADLEARGARRAPTVDDVVRLVEDLAAGG